MIKEWALWLTIVIAFLILRKTWRQILKEAQRRLRVSFRCAKRKHVEGPPIKTSVWIEWYCLDCQKRLRYERRSD